MGRKKLTNERFQVRCHPNVIKYVRTYAKLISEQELLKQKNNPLNQMKCQLKK